MILHLMMQIKQSYAKLSKIHASQSAATMGDTPWKIYAQQAVPNIVDFSIPYRWALGTLSILTAVKLQCPASGVLSVFT